MSEFTRLLTRVAFRLIAVIAALVVASVAVELLSITYLTIKSKHFISARQRLDARKNTFVDAMTRSGADCRYIDTLYPHPYLGFVHHGNPPCGLSDVNNIGLFGPDYPSERPSDRFVVLVTGGSVAAQFMMPVDHRVSYLEQILNERYDSPTGRPFLLLDGGDGAWKQPQQTFLFLLYADAVHAVVTLDGFNEHFMLLSDTVRRFESPTNFAIVNPTLNREFSTIVKQWVAGRVFGYASHSPILSRSQTAYIALELIDGYLRRPQVMQPQKTTLETIFALPSAWTATQKMSWGIGQYAKYLRAIDVVAAEQHVLSVHFIQPVPAIDKVLTENERMHVGDLGYADIYRQMVNSLLGLSSKGSKVFSLLDLYRDISDSVYADSIHCIIGSDNHSLGYRLMAERIADTLAKTWHLHRKV